MRRLLLFVGCCLLFAATAAASSRAREIQPARPGLNILPIDALAVVGSREGFADLRLVDARGSEVPYMLVGPEGGERRWSTGPLRAIPATKERSGFELELPRAVDADAVRIGGVAAPYLKRVTVEGSGDRARWTVLAPETTIFDLPDQRLARDVVAFVPSSVRYIRIVFDDRSSARALPATIEVREAGVAAAQAPLIALDYAKPLRRGQKTLIRIRLPEKGFPLTAIVPRVDRGAVYREAKVTEPRMSGRSLAPAALGDATLRRAEVGGEVASDLRIPIARPETAEIELTIDDGSNPPLPIVAIEGEIAPQPAIVFESADGAPLTAQWGDAKLAAPRYDIEALRPRLATLPLARASWGAPHRAAGALAVQDPVDLAVPAGAKVNPGEFRWSRVIRGGNGLVAVPIDAAALAHGKPGIDWRIVDVKDRQVPYLVESGSEPIRLEIPLPRRSEGARPNVSRYVIELPYAGLPDATLVLRTGASFFRRDVSLIRPPIEERGDEAEISSSLWAHADDGVPAPPLAIALPPRAAASYIVEIDEKENAPLPITAVELVLPSYRMRYLNPRGEELRLLYGNAAAPAPSYDLQLLASRLLAAPALEATLAPEQDQGSSRGKTEVAFFWAVVAAAAIALLALTAKLLR